MPAALSCSWKAKIKSASTILRELLGLVRGGAASNKIGIEGRETLKSWACVSPEPCQRTVRYEFDRVTPPFIRSPCSLMPCKCAPV